MRSALSETLFGNHTKRKQDADACVLLFFAHLAENSSNSGSEEVSFDAAFGSVSVPGMKPPRPFIKEEVGGG